MKKRDIVKELKQYLSNGGVEQTKFYIDDQNQAEHIEGSIWEEGGKKWTIKNGIRKTVSRYSEIRNICMLPYVCPRCGNALHDNDYNRKVYSILGICYDCFLLEETNHIINKTHDENQKEIIHKNKVSWFNQVESELKDYLDNIDSDQFITEDGQIEDWSKQNSDQLKQAVTDKLMEIKEQIITAINKD